MVRERRVSDYAKLINNTINESSVEVKALLSYMGLKPGYKYSDFSVSYLDRVYRAVSSMNEMRSIVRLVNRFSMLSDGEKTNINPTPNLDRILGNGFNDRLDGIVDSYKHDCYCKSSWVKERGASDSVVDPMGGEGLMAFVCCSTMTIMSLVLLYSFAKWVSYLSG